MTQPQSPESAESPEQPRRAFFRRLPLPRRRRTRWLALGATAVVLAGLAGTAAIAVHHGEREGRDFAGREFGGRAFGGGSEGGRHGGGRSDGGRSDGGQDGRRFQGGDSRGDSQGSFQGSFQGGDWQGGSSQEAPAPLPALPADQAAVKAAAAVPGGRVDGLTVVGQQGGGSAWQLDVLGADGVRHLLTVDASGTITSNTTR